MTTCYTQPNNKQQYYSLQNTLFLVLTQKGFTLNYQKNSTQVEGNSLHIRL